MKKVVYVPLDDRPVNLDDVILQGRAAGIHVITPNSADIVNRPDTQKTANGTTLESTSSPVYGNSGAIRQFILDHAAAADGFILSTDMLAYGGLIGGRRLRTSDSAAYPNYDAATTGLLDVIALVKQNYPDKPIYVLDTIMRLATTAFTGGLSFDVYNESRGFMLQPRRVFSEIDDILDGYNLSPNGSYGDTVLFDKEHYYNTRRHKFKSNRYILEQLAGKGYIDFLAIGVDDAHTQGVQINEIKYVEACIDTWLDGSGGQNPDRAIVLPDADGLGQALMARMANHLHNSGAKPGYAVHYFGPHGSTIISPYEYMDVHQNIQRHVDIVGGTVVEDCPAIEIIAITAASEVSAAIGRIAANNNRHIPSVVIDFVDLGKSNPVVTDALLSSEHTGRLLGYSAWNTAGNKMGLALGMGQARYAYLTSGVDDTLGTAMNAHGSLLFKRFLKDYYYKSIAIADIRNYSRNHSLYTNVSTLADQNMRLFNSPADYTEMQTMLREKMQLHTATLAGSQAFQAGNKAIRQICASTWNMACYACASLVYENPDFIWGRAFEITLRPSLTLK